MVLAPVRVKEPPHAALARAGTPRRGVRGRLGEPRPYLGLFAATRAATFSRNAFKRIKPVASDWS